MKNLITQSKMRFTVTICFHLYQKQVKIFRIFSYKALRIKFLIKTCKIKTRTEIIIYLLFKLTMLKTRKTLIQVNLRSLS